MAFFPVYDVTGSTTDRPEALGTKEKFWLVPHSDVGLTIAGYLFKIGRPSTGENWAEKVCCEILRAAEMPCASYEFAVHGTDQGVVSQQFVPVNGTFVPANMILQAVVKEYDGQLRFRQRRYQVTTCLNVIRQRAIEPPLWTPSTVGDMTAADIFVGYLVFDILVSNTDRHHENWGVVIDHSNQYNPTFRLAPTFDHASSLGRNESDDARRRRLNTIDRRDTVEAYTSRARSALYGPTANERPLLQSEVLDTLIRVAPAATTRWARIFSSIPRKVFEDIFARIDPTLISDEATKFALRMLDANCETIRRAA
ncbi:HipA domain-containing protein [Bradyrhizobium sp. 4]|uniref:HipA domain-containing protein n=1 Tax=unclassified Bradyrhizobium TaxID=2631580 RepID=UPI001FF9D8F0|nr:MULTISPECIES: HipA domain-containing protein [unclassified Bradyrhizobium]MCK1402346.1 HipA domain-containing protein [Bradyrhizobium sp. 39]MCK1747941.1 HipA domain-containing protein [Bradyrhizobium sp. 135]UPJ32434.1 HipA domain-containing protein [Bradyrhizobium sp. 4]